MKKILSLIVVCAVSIVMLVGCSESSGGAASGNNGSADITATNSSSDTQSVDASGYEKSFEGFVQYMTEGGYIKGDGTDLTAAAIGAKQGKRYTISSGTSKYYVELYEYEDQTSDIAQRTIANAKGDHSFHLMDSTESATANTYAVVTEEGKFLMLFTDSSSNDAPSEKKESAAKAVESFK